MSRRIQTSALATVRVDCKQIKIKTTEDASNPLLPKRWKKAWALETAQVFLLNKKINKCVCGGASLVIAVRIRAGSGSAGVGQGVYTLTPVG